MTRDNLQDSTVDDSDNNNDNELNDDDNEDEDDMDIDFLFEEEEDVIKPTEAEVAYENLDAMEKVWRHAKKPLLRIGAKGATHSHGNSLRQLLDDHTVVKVKVNTRKFGKIRFMRCKFGERKQNIIA